MRTGAVVRQFAATSPEQVSIYFKQAPATLDTRHMSDSGVSSDGSTITRVEFVQERASQFKSAAEDARSLLRTNFLILGFFLPIIASFFTNQLDPERVFNNAYTQIGLIVWFFSTVLVSYTYHRARVVAKTQLDPVEAAMLGDIPEDERRYRIQDKIDEYSSTTGFLDKLITACTVLTLFATTLLALGVLLPYVSIIPQVDVPIVFVVVVLVTIVLYVAYKYRYKLPSIRKFLSRNKNGWNDLTRPRKNLLKKIYVKVGREPFQLSDLPLQTEGPLQSGTIPISTTDDSNILLRDVSDEKISEYLLEQMADEGYFEKQGNTDKTTLKSPYSFEEFTITEIGDEVEGAIDMLAKKLEQNDEAREAAANEFSLRPNEVLETLQAGDELERVKRHNRIIERLDDEDVDMSLRPFEFTDEVTYFPTELAEDAYDKIEMEKRTREYDRQMAEKREQTRRAENTHRCEVIDPPEDYGKLQVLVYDTFGENRHESLHIDEAQVSESEREVLEDLEKGEEVQLRIERNAPGSGPYIASVGGP